METTAQSATPKACTEIGMKTLRPVPRGFAPRTCIAKELSIFAADHDVFIVQSPICAASKFVPAGLFDEVPDAPSILFLQDRATKGHQLEMLAVLDGYFRAPKGMSRHRQEAVEVPA
jgi:hypothetical protein